MCCEECVGELANMTEDRHGQRGRRRVEVAEGNDVTSSFCATLYEFCEFPRLNDAMRTSLLGTILPTSRNGLRICGQQRSNTRQYPARLTWVSKTSTRKPPPRSNVTLPAALPTNQSP